MAAQVHPTAIIEEGVTLGEGTAVWDHAHIRANSSIGDQCLIGGKAYIAYHVHIGNRVKVNSLAYICHGVTIDDGVMISAGVIFTNDRLPRATTPDLQLLRPSEPNERTLSTRVLEGATIGAGAIIGPGLTIGRFAMVGMGAVVTRSVSDFQLVAGNPARVIGSVCRCGESLCRFSEAGLTQSETVTCASCGHQYCVEGATIFDHDGSK